MKFREEFFGGSSVIQLPSSSQLTPTEIAKKLEITEDKVKDLIASL